MILAGYKKILTSALLSCCMAVMISAIPIGSMGLQKAEAITIGPVTIAFDFSATGLGTLAESAISAAVDQVVESFSSWDNFKNRVLDPLFWQLANAVLKNMINSTTAWVANGFEGSPAFVTDLEGFLINAADTAAGEFLKSKGLGFICSPFKLDLQIALSTEYYSSGKNFKAQCTLSGIVDNMDNFLNGTFSEGGWAGWFELTQGTHNDPNRAFLDLGARMNATVRNAEGQEYSVLRASNFFLDVKQCDEVTDPGNGESSEVCRTSTPGNVVQAQLNDTLGIPRDRLVVADEFNELVGTLFSQIALQAFSGVGGLLGLGGAEGYKDHQYGSSGNAPYFEAIEEETLVILLESENPIIDTIAEQDGYVSLELGVIGLIDGVSTRIEAGKTKYPSCFNINLPADLANRRSGALAKIEQTERVADQLILLNYDYNNARSVTEQLDILTVFNELKASGQTISTVDIAKIDVELQFTLPPKISTARNEITDELQRCEEESDSNPDTSDVDQSE
ncbi:MAG: hypothetical protein ACI9VM_000170 [Candidatus Azotimanducaceae bacterium]|jgi:hypothetical protein